MFFPYLNLTKVNVATLSQSNTAVGSIGASQTLAQLQSNSAAINQG